MKKLWEHCSHPTTPLGMFKVSNRGGNIFINHLLPNIYTLSVHLIFKYHYTRIVKYIYD